MNKTNLLTISLGAVGLALLMFVYPTHSQTAQRIPKITYQDTTSNDAGVTLGEILFDGVKAGCSAVFDTGTDVISLSAFNSGRAEITYFDKSKSGRGIFYDDIQYKIGFIPVPAHVLVNNGFVTLPLSRLEAHNATVLGANIGTIQIKKDDLKRLYKDASDCYETQSGK